MSVLGIDPGTSRWAFVFLENGRLADEAVVSTDEISSNPQIVLDFVKQAELIIAPSGYGIPIKKVGDLNSRDYKEILLKRKGEGQIMGLENVIRMLARENVNAYVIPGVKLLPSVPTENKFDKIDMGTPDKLCVAVAAISQKLHYNEANFVLAEIGYGFDAFVKVENGQIVDGIGGTMASSTWKGADGEILYLKGKISKSELRKGKITAEEVAEAAFEDIVHLGAKEVLVSGSQSDKVFPLLQENFEDISKLDICKSSNAAYGAAIIADGLSGGKFKELVEHIQIRKASGSNLDYVTLGLS